MSPEAGIGAILEHVTENPRLDPWAPLQKSATPQNAQVAQSVEQRTENPRVDGSIPPLGTMNFKGSDLIGAFFISAFRFFSGLSGVVKSIDTLPVLSEKETPG